jgi:predicted DNA-binding transcriptional regulator AlpA
MPSQEAQRAQLPELPESGFLRLPQVLQLYPVSRSAWWAGIKEGRYPPGVKLAPRTTAWSCASIRALLEKTAADAHDSKRP